ncbi:MAG: CHAT domain-containing tetratricopeptide repeat protein [Planctomycetota bacterium]
MADSRSAATRRRKALPLLLLAVLSLAFSAGAQVDAPDGLTAEQASRRARDAWQARQEERARSLYEQARALADELDDDALRARVDADWGILLEEAERYGDAAAVLEQAARAADRAGDTALRSTVASHLGQALASLQRYDAAAAELDLVLTAAAAPGDLQPLADAALVRGTCMVYLSQPSRAAHDFELAEALYHQLGQRAGAARAAANASGAYEVIHRYSDALEASVRALRVFEELGDGMSAAHVRINRGIYFAALGRSDEALLCLEQAQTFFEATDASFGLGRVSMQRAMVLRNLDQVGAALRELDVAEVHLRERPVGDQLAWVVLTRAQLLLRQGLPREALGACERAMELFADAGNRWKLAEAQLERANALVALGETEEALASLDRAAAGLPERDDRRTLAAIARTRGRALADRGRHREALDCFAESLDLAEEVLLDQAQALGPSSSEGVRARLDELPGLCFASWARLSRAEGVARQELDALGDVVYRAVQLVYGLNVVEARAGAREGPAVSPEISTQLRALEREQHELAQRRTALAADGDVWGEPWRDVQRLIRIASEREAALVQRARTAGRGAVRPARGAEVRAAIPPGVTLVEFVLGAARHGQPVFCSRTTRDGTELFDLGDADAVRRASGALVELLSAGAEPDARLLRELGAGLLDPVLGQGASSGVETLLVAAHGELANLPFETLLTRDVDPDAPRARWPYLIRSHDVAYVHSGTLLREMRRRQRTPGAASCEFLGFARSPAVSPGTGVAAEQAPIPGALSEVLTVARLFAVDAERAEIDAQLARLSAGGTPERETLVGERFEVLLQEQASESNLKARSGLRAGILHLACHGDANAAAPPLSRLLLAASPPLEDGDLFARELALLDLRVELCVLSGCDTGAGALSSVEGASSLSRAALMAGAGAVIAAGWPVADGASRDLMVRFYGHLAGGATRVRALSEAKRAAIAASQPESSWAAFRLWDARPAP